MDKSLERIYKYLDGELTQQEMSEFETEILANSSMAQLYNSQLTTHKALLQFPAHSAPDHLIDNVMSVVAQKKFSSEKYNSFAGLKYIAIGAIITLAISVIVAFALSNQNFSGYSFDSLTMYDKAFSEYLPIHKLFYSYSIYICILLSIPLLIGVDKYAQKYVRKSNMISRI
jgi:hypothetical protein